MKSKALKHKKRGKKDIYNRIPWTKKENEAVTELVKVYGNTRWSLISEKLKEVYGIYDRTAKQCRERYLYFNI